MRRHKKLAVKIPPGVDNGDRVRLAGEGEAGRNGGPPGDLYVEVQVREHPIFERDGAHLCCEVPLSLCDRGAGRHGRGADARWRSDPEDSARDAVRPRVPAARQGRQAGARRRAGDLFCRVMVETPVKLSAEQRELLQRFDESLRDDGNRHAPRQKSFLEGVKRFFKSAP